MKDLIPLFVKCGGEVGRRAHRDSSPFRSTHSPGAIHTWVPVIQR
jgi:hypothetical protein